MKIQNIQPVIQNYAWGDISYLQDLTGHQELIGREPWAELWVGTHPKGMSRTREGQPLDEFMASHQEEVFGPSLKRLPLLFKILAVKKPLSIQCHPTIAQAVEGFELEQGRGIPLDAPQRNYKDRNHKPEILCAITPFTAMCGFRPVEEIRQLMQRIIPTVYASWFAPLFTGTYAPSDILRSVLSIVLDSSAEDSKTITAMIRADMSSSSDQSLESELIRRFLGYYPEDPSVLAPCYLNVLTLSPGEALFQPAGELHAYVEGIGIELMANSDNVLRGGLTPKHIDSGELLRIVAFGSVQKQKTYPETDEFGRESFRTPSQEFLLSRSVSGKYEVALQSVEFALQIEGSSSFIYTDPQTGESCSYHLRAGEVCMIPAALRSYICEVEGLLFTAGIPEDV